MGLGSQKFRLLLATADTTHFGGQRVLALEIIYRSRFDATWQAISGGQVEGRQWFWLCDSVITSKWGLVRTKSYIRSIHIFEKLSRPCTKSHCFVKLDVWWCDSSFHALVAWIFFPKHATIRVPLMGLKYRVGRWSLIGQMEERAARYWLTPS